MLGDLAHHGDSQILWWGGLCKRCYAVTGLPLPRFVVLRSGRKLKYRFRNESLMPVWECCKLEGGRVTLTMEKGQEVSFY